MSRPSLSRRFVGLTLAVTAAGGIGVGAWSTWGPEIVQPYRTAASDITTPPITPPTTPLSAAARGAGVPSGVPAIAGVTLAQAEAIATQASPGTVVKTKKHDDGPVMVFEVEIQHANGADTKIKVDATSGRVITVENDNQPHGNGPH